MTRRLVYWIAGVLLMQGCQSVVPNITSAPTQHTPSATESTTYAPTIFTVQHDPGTASAARLADARPNIIFILTDDQPYHTVAYMPTVRDVLMTGGVVFENGFVTTPLCCPSRVSIWTGQYAHNHGVLTNRLPLGGAQKFDETLSSALWLQAVGYHTAYFGKYLNEYESLTPLGRVPAGWDTWGALLDRVQSAEDTGSENSYESYSFSENGQIMEGGVFSADWVTQRSVDFISASRDAPFFLVMAYYNPHTPYFWADRHDGQFRANSFLRADPYRPPNFLEADVSDKPEYFQQLIDGLSVEKIDTRYNHLLRSLLSVDDGVASVLAELDQMNLRDNTIVVFISDNGLTVGNHVPGMMKNCVYEECIRVPFIVYAPAFFAARTDLRLVANIDLAPTFADLSGAPIPDSVDGLSLLPLLYDPSIPWRDGLLLEHWPTDGETHLIPEFHAIRTSEWKYVEYVTGEVELYDLINDPYELSNLAALPECVRCGGVEG